MTLSFGWLALSPSVAASGPALGLRSTPIPGLKADVAALLVQGVEGGALPVVASVLTEEAFESAQGSGRLRLPLVVETAGSVLLEQVSDSRAADPLELELYVYALDESQGVAAHLAASVEVRLDRLGEAVAGAGIRFVDVLDLAPGRYSVRMLLVDVKSRAFGLNTVDIELTDPLLAGENVWATRPRVEGGCAPWLVAWPAEARTIRVTGDSLDSRLGAIESRPVLVPGERSRLLAVGRPAPSGPLAGDRGLRVRLAGAGGHSETIEPVDVEVRRLPGGGERFAIEFEVPLLPPGSYDVSVSAPGPSSAGEERSPPLEIWLVRGEEPQAACQTWASLRRRALTAAGSETSTASAPSAVDPGRRRRREALQEAYRETLAAFGSTTDLRKAVDRLVELESRLLESESGQIEALAEAELTVVRQLFADDPECVLPILVLHHEAYEAHYQQRSFGLARHSRLVVGALVDWLLEEDRRPNDLEPIANVLTSLADYAEQHLMVFESQAMLRKAVDFLPGHEAARLLLALSYERVGFYDRARRQLDIILEANSGLAEARLRRAVMLARSGDLEGAVRQTDRLVRERPEEWILALSFQVMAQSLGRAGRIDEAVETLQRAVGLLPDDQRLRLQLAYWLERGGRRRQAMEAIAGIPMSGSETASSRLRYTRLATSKVDPVRADLRAAVGVRLLRLRAAVERISGTG